MVLINPILSLKFHLELEKEHKFFYKKLLRELSSAYQTDQKILESENFSSMEESIVLDGDIPVKIIHVLSGGKSHKQTKQYQKIISEQEISPHYILPEKKQQLGSIFIKFFNQHETVL
jgi:hypothetical protein